MDTKNYNLDSLEGSSKINDDSCIVYKSLNTDFRVVVDEPKSITWEEYKKEFSAEQNLRNLEEFEMQISSGNVEGEDFEVFMDRFKREHSWATN